MASLDEVDNGAAVAVTPLSGQDVQRLVDIRHHLHQHPELGFHETGTSAFIADQLRAHGIEVERTSLTTGVVGRISGGAPGPHIALRGDIDGLPVTEHTGLPFSSRNPGVMHACGHDLHITGLLGAAFALQRRRKEIPGTVTLLFQPAEETSQGAVEVLKAGLIDDLDAVVGAHNYPDLAPGQVGLSTHPIMAGCVRFRVSLHAHGTHAAYPQAGTGPLEALSTMVLALQTIVSRNASPFHAVVVSVTEVHGGSVWNVVPAEAGFGGTVRYFDDADERLVQRRFRTLVKSIAAGYGIAADVEWQINGIPVVSDAELEQAVAEQVPSYATVVDPQPSMAGEDFADYSRKTRVVFAFLGSNGRPGHPGLHSPEFVGLDEEIPTAVHFYESSALAVLRRLA